MAKMNNSGTNPTSPLMPPLACASIAAGWFTTFSGFQTYKAFYLPSESSARTSLSGEGLAASVFIVLLLRESSLRATAAPDLIALSLPQATAPQPAFRGVPQAL